MLVAAGNGKVSTSRLLIEKGANIEASDKNGWTPLMSAAVRGYDAVVRLLIEKGAKVNATKADGGTALMVASEGGKEKTVKILLDKGAKIDVVNKDGKTPVLVAADYQRLEVLRELLARGGKLTEHPVPYENALIKCNYHVMVASNEFARYCKDAAAKSIEKSSTDPSISEKAKSISLAAWTFLLAKDINAATRYADEAGALDPKELTTIFNCGHVYLINGDRKKAVESYRYVFKGLGDYSWGRDALSRDMTLLRIVYPDRAKVFDGVIEELR